MAWKVVDPTTRTNMLTQVNNGLGAAAKFSWQNASSQELAITALYSGGTPFTVGTGVMDLRKSDGTTTTPLQLLSTNFAGGGLTKVVMQTNGSANIVEGTVTVSGGGGDVQVDAIPTGGQQLRFDSLQMSVVSA